MTSTSSSSDDWEQTFAKTPVFQLRGPISLRQSSLPSNGEESSESYGNGEGPYTHANTLAHTMPSPKQTASSEKSFEKLCKERDRITKELEEVCKSACRPLPAQSQTNATAVCGPLNIVFIGTPGVGKSSLICSIGAALGRRWHEFTTIGKGKRGTIVLQRISKCCLSSEGRLAGDFMSKITKMYEDVPLPTLIDVAGLNDEDDDTMVEFLKLLLYGHIQPGSKVKKVYEDCKNLEKGELRDKYRTCYPETRADRVVIVATAGDAENPSSVESDNRGLPLKLLACVEKVARGDDDDGDGDDIVGGRGLPVFGVLTRKDKVDPRSAAFQARKNQFMKTLNLNFSNFFLLSCYCDDLVEDLTKREELSLPELDVPVLAFLKEVCDPNRVVLNPEQRLVGGTGPIRRLVRKWRRVLLPSSEPSIFLRSAVISLLSFAMFFLGAMSVFEYAPDRTKAAVCSDPTLRKESAVDLMCTEQSVAKRLFDFFESVPLPVYAAILVLSVLITALLWWKDCDSKQTLQPDNEAQMKSKSD